MSPDWPWSELGLDKPATTREIKSAYAKKLKTIDRADVTIFQRLQTARDAAFKQATDFAHKSQKARPNIRTLRNKLGEQKEDFEDQAWPQEETKPIDPPRPEQSVNLKPKEPVKTPKKSIKTVEIYEQEEVQEKKTAEVEVTPPAQSKPPKPAQSVNLKPKEPVQTPKKPIKSVEINEQQEAKEDKTAFFKNEFEYKETVLPPDVEDESMARVKRLLENKEFKAISAVYGQSIFQNNKALRNKIEILLAEKVLTFYTAKKKVPKDLAEVIDQEFLWTTDSIAAKHRLEKHFSSSHILIASIKKPRRKSEDGDDLEPITTKSVIALLCCLGIIAHSLYSGVWLNDDPEKSTLAFFFITLISSVIMAIAFSIPIMGLWWLSYPFRKYGLNQFGAYLLKQSSPSFRTWFKNQDFKANETIVILGMLMLLFFAYLAPYFADVSHIM